MLGCGWLIGLTLVAAGLDEPAPGAGRSIDFNREIRPIFARSCFGCHGPKARKGGLALHRKAQAMAGGDEGAVILPGKPLESRLYRYVAGLDDDHPMPPEGSGEPLKPDQLATLRTWLDQGAVWPLEKNETADAALDHWAFRKPVRPDLPATGDPAWSRNPIDRFVLARLDREGLTPSPEADRATLIRRLSLDLIGLPPTIAESDAFLTDPRPDAYERLVDRLLASPHYGERWARRWLDGARYADTNGYEKDRERSIWPYRDWVIRALNEDLPFDRFTIEQIAGDLLPGASEAQRVATGFHRNTMINEEGGIDVEEFRFASIVDRVATTGAVWLGLTIQCAQCHTHKFDPITQREYYRFFAFFNNVDEPELGLVDPTIASKRAQIDSRIQALEAQLPDRFPEPDRQQTWTVLTPEQAEARSGSTLQLQADGSILAVGASPTTDTYEVEFEANFADVTAVRLETLAHPSLPHQGPGRAPNGNFVLTEFSAMDDEGHPVRFENPQADGSQAGFSVEGMIDQDPATAWAVDLGAGKLNTTHIARFDVDSRTLPKGQARLTFQIGQEYGGSHTLGRFRISVSRDVDRLPGTSETRRRAWLLERRQKWEKELKLTRWNPVAPRSTTSAKHATMTVLEDRSVLVSGDKPNNDIYQVVIPIERPGVSAIRLEVLPDESLPEGGPGRAPLFSVGNFFLSEVEAQLQPTGQIPSKPLTIRQASADFEEPSRPAASTLDGKMDTGWAVGGGVGRPHSIVFRLKEPIPEGEGSRLVLTLHQLSIHQTTIGRFRVSTTSDLNPPGASGLTAESEEIALIPPAQRSSDQNRKLERHFLSTVPEMAPAFAEIEALRKSKPRYSTSMILQERPPAQARITQIHRRGEFLQPAGPVEPGVPSFLAALPENPKPDRLSLARWLVSEENPVVPRVIVNRAWQAFFGRGLVRTLEDFGTRGERPTHPELLDWLATEFPRQGWSQKAIHRLIATSATYRQVSRASPELMARDPRNELLARGPRFRVDSEMIRDLALAAGGLLDPRIGGPSVFPPQPDGVSSLSYGQAAWPTSKGADRYRRGLYTYTKRTAPFAAFATFDAPTPEVACVRRERSNTPLQALTLLNDPAFVEAARAIGRRVVLEGPADPEGKARLAFRWLVGRVPTQDEVVSIVEFRARQADRLNSGDLDPAKVNGSKPPGDPLESAAWSIVARALLNLDETITKE